MKRRKPQDVFRGFCTPGILTLFHHRTGCSPAQQSWPHPALSYWMTLLVKHKHLGFLIKQAIELYAYYRDIVWAVHTWLLFHCIQDLLNNIIKVNSIDRFQHFNKIFAGFTIGQENMAIVLLILWKRTVLEMDMTKTGPLPFKTGLKLNQYGTRQNRKHTEVRLPGCYKLLQRNSHLL